MWGAGSPWLQFDPHLHLNLLLLLALLDPGHLYQTLLQVMMKKMKELAIDIKLSHECFILTFWAPIAFTNTVIQCWFSAPTFKLQGSPSQWYLTCFPWGQLRRRVDRVHLLTSVPPHSNFLLSTIFSSNALQSPPLPPPRSPNIEFVSFPANSRVVNAQRIHDNILCVLLLQPYKLWLFCRICLLVRPDSDFQVLILKYFLTPLKLLICTLYKNCIPILLNFLTL